MENKNTLSQSLSRRAFVQGGAAAVLTASSYARVWGANNRIGVGFIGFGLIGKQHVFDFRQQSDVNLVAVAEVHRGRLEEAKALIGWHARWRVKAISTGFVCYLRASRPLSMRPWPG